MAAWLRSKTGDISNIEIDAFIVDSVMLLMATACNQTIATNAAPPLAANRGFVGSPGVSTFETAYGHVSVAANTMGQFRVVCSIVCRPDLAQLPYLLDRLSDSDFLFDLAEYTRSNATKFRHYLFNKGLNYASVVRMFGTLRAVINLVFSEFGLSISNPFSNVSFDRSAVVMKKTASIV